MTEYQINCAAILWLKGKDTLDIAREVCPSYQDVRGYSRGGEADVYNSIGLIKAQADELLQQRA